MPVLGIMAYTNYFIGGILLSTEKIVASGLKELGKIRAISASLTPFPSESGQIAAYLKALNPILEHGIVTKSPDAESKRVKLQLIIASLNIYRLVEVFEPEIILKIADELQGSKQIGEKLNNWLMFCDLAKRKYEMSPPATKIDVSQDIFDAVTYDKFSAEAELRIQALISQYPITDTHEKGVHIVKKEPSDSSSESEDSGASSPRDNDVSLTCATLRRLLRNYWHAKEIGVSVDDKMISRLWDNSIVGQEYVPTIMASILAILPIELDFLVDRDTGIVKAFDIGTSHEIDIRDLEPEEVAKYTIIIHNHPRGDTFSLSDLTICARKQAKEVRAVTLAEAIPGECVLKTYCAEVIYQAGFSPDEHVALINAFYLYFGNGFDIKNVLDDLGISVYSLQFRENEFSVLEAAGLINFHETLDRTFNAPNPQQLRVLFADHPKLLERKLSEDQILVARRYLEEFNG